MGKYGTGDPRQSKAIETGMILFIDRVAADFFGKVCRTIKKVLEVPEIF